MRRCYSGSFAYDVTTVFVIEIREPVVFTSCFIVDLLIVGLLGAQEF